MGWTIVYDPSPSVNGVVAAMNSWVYHPVFKIVSDFEASLKREPPIPPGTPDPYVPLKK